MSLWAKKTSSDGLGATVAGDELSVVHSLRVESMGSIEACKRGHSLVRQTVTSFAAVRDPNSSVRWRVVIPPSSRSPDKRCLTVTQVIAYR